MNLVLSVRFEIVSFAIKVINAIRIPVKIANIL